MRDTSVQPVGRTTARPRSLCVAAMFGLLAVAGCDRIDPLERPYMWHESGTNPHNIAAMAANPADLVHGRDAPVRRSAMDSDSVDRLWTGKTVALPSDNPGATSSGSISQTGGGNSSSGGGT